MRLFVRIRDILVPICLFCFGIRVLWLFDHLSLCAGRSTSTLTGDYFWLTISWLLMYIHWELTLLPTIWRFSLDCQISIFPIPVFYTFLICIFRYSITSIILYFFVYWLLIRVVTLDQFVILFGIRVDCWVGCTCCSILRIDILFYSVCRITIIFIS